MPEETSKETRGTCFVVMGFGKKTDFQTGRVLDLDMTYENIIKPAVNDANLKCIRSDEIVHTGVIDVPMYRLLLTADVVIADLSTSNSNAFYELGVRHALRPHTTIIVAEDQLGYPFDVNHTVIRRYHHLGADIGYSEVMRFRRELKEALDEVLRQPSADSPVYTYLRGLRSPTLAEVEAMTEAGKGAVAAATPSSANEQTLSMLIQKANEAQKKGDFDKAKTFLITVREMMKPKDENTGRQEDPYIIQRLALATYKNEEEPAKERLEEARDLLATLNPTTSNDTGTLGLWGAVHKHLWEVTKDKAYLDEAVRAYGRGFYLRNDEYNGINLAFLLNGRAAYATNHAEAIADFIQAERVRREVLLICEALLERENLQGESKNWALATMAEAYFGIGDEENAQRKREEALAAPHAPWMKETTEKQMAKLRQLLADSPLKYVKTDADL